MVCLGIILKYTDSIRYHSKCLKITRKSIKNNEKYTCPICDYRIEIPRGSHRPKIEELTTLVSQACQLRVYPRQLPILESIIQTGNFFRDHLTPFMDENRQFNIEEADILRFYLRKLEGAEILLRDETNFFRRKLHKLCPMAPSTPELIGESKATRKPRSKPAAQGLANGEPQLDTNIVRISTIPSSLVAPEARSALPQLGLFRDVAPRSNFENNEDVNVEQALLPPPGFTSIE